MRIDRSEFNAHAHMNPRAVQPHAIPYVDTQRARAALKRHRQRNRWSVARDVAGLAAMVLMGLGFHLK